jgi:hypothetical protein
MVALLKENGEFTPMPVVVDTAKYEQLKASMAEQPKVVPGLVALAKRARGQFVVVTAK